MVSFLDISDYGRSQLSALLSGGKISPDVVRLRKQSCFGGSPASLPCENLRPSKSMPDHHICNGCGCGENKILEIAILKFPYLVDRKSVV